MKNAFPIESKSIKIEAKVKQLLELFMQISLELSCYWRF